MNKKILNLPNNRIQCGLASGYAHSSSGEALYQCYNWTASSELGTYRLCEQRRFRRACSSAQSRQNLRCSLILAVSQEEHSDRKPDPWPLWMAGHAQLKFVMTECSKTQIRLTGFIWRIRCNVYWNKKSWGTKHSLRKCRNELEPNECRNHKQERKPYQLAQLFRGGRSVKLAHEVIYNIHGCAHHTKQRSTTLHLKVVNEKINIFKIWQSKRFIHGYIHPDTFN